MPVRYGLIEPTDISLPNLPPVLERLRIAHLSDLHITRRRTPRGRMTRLANQLTTLRLDLVLLTGDYMSKPGDEEVAFELLQRLCEKIRPNLGMFGVFGNHDTQELRERVEELPVHWLHNQRTRLPNHPIELLGLGMLQNERPDAVALALHQPTSPACDKADHGTNRPTARSRTKAAAYAGPPLRIMLAHSPSSLTTASDMGVDLMLCGHTHGGQIRLPRFSMVGGGGRALINACDLPLHLSSGLLRHRRTMAAVSRGLGEVGLLRTRLWCRPHAPVYTLHRRSMPGRVSPTIDLIEAW